MGFTLIFDGLFILLEAAVSLESSSFDAAMYLLFTAMMLSVPFFYYFATIYLLSEDGPAKKDYWMLGSIAVTLVIDIFVISRVQALGGNTFQTVLYALDDAAFLVFLIEWLFVQIFCFTKLAAYKKQLDEYYSSRNGKSLGSITLLMALVATRLLLYIGINFFPAIAGTLGYHLVQTVLFSLFFIIIALFTCKIDFTAEQLGKLKKAAAIEEKIPSGNDFIKEKMDRLIENKFYLDSGIDLMGVSSQMHVNYKYITDYIKYNYHETFMVFVNRLRIEYSQTLLKDKSLSIPDIAEQSGFISESTYLRNFIKVRGITPSKFRKTE